MKKGAARVAFTSAHLNSQSGRGRHRRWRLLTMSAMCALGTSAAHAQSLYWDVNGAAPGAGGPLANGSWDLILTNWNVDSAGAGLPVSWSAGNTAVFAAGTDATGAYTATIPAGVVIPGVNGITFEEGNVLIGAGDAASALTLTAPTISTAGNHQIDAIIGGAVGLTKTGAGSLLLRGANTYTGVTHVDAGRIFVSHNDALGGAADGVTFNALATAVGRGISLTNNVTINKPITLNNGSGNAIPGGQIDNFSGNNIWSGQISLNSTTSSLGQGNAMITATSGTLRITGNIVNGGAAATNHSFSKAGDGSLVLASANTFGGFFRPFSGYTILESNDALGASGAQFTNGTFFLGHTTSNATMTVALRGPGGGNLSYSSNEILSMAGLPRPGEGLLDNFGGQTFAGAIQLANTSVLTPNQVVIPTMFGVSQDSLTLTGVLSNSAAFQRSFMKVGPGPLILTAANTFSGPAIIERGVVSFAGPDGRVDSATPIAEVQASFDVYPGAGIRFDNSAAVRNNRISVPVAQVGGVPVRLFGGDFTLLGNDAAPVNTTNVGGSLRIHGHSSIQVRDSGGGTVLDLSAVGAANRVARGTAVFRGTIGGAPAGPGNANVFLPAAINGVIGGTSGPGTPGVPILPWALGDPAAGIGSDFATYGPNGVRRLDPATEYFPGAIAGLSGPNFINSVMGAAQVVPVPTAINSIKFAGAGADLTIDPGVILALEAGGILNASGGAIGILGPTGTLRFNNEGVVFAHNDMAIQPTIVGLTGMTKSGAGDLILRNNSNDFGPLTINEGAVAVDNEGQLGPTATGAIVFNGGFLRPAAALGGLASGRAISTESKLGGFDIPTGQTFTVGNDIAGAGALTKIGGGDLRLGGNNTFATGLIVNDGAVIVSADNQLGINAIPPSPTVNANGAAAITLDGGALRVNGTFALDADRTILYGNDGGVIEVLAGNVFTNPAFSWGRGGLTKAGDGEMIMGSTVLTTFSQYLGNTRIFGGTLTYQPNGAGNFVGLANTPPGLVPDYFHIANGATLRVNGNSTTAGNFGAANRGITLGVGGGNLDVPAAFSWNLNAPVTGPGSLTKTGTGSLTLNSPNTYAGGTGVNGGLLRIANDNRLGAPAGPIGFNGGVLQTTAAITSARNVTVGAGNGSFDTNTFNSTLSGNLGGPGTFNKIGAGNLTVKHVRSAGLNIATGRVNVTAGAAAGEPDRVSNVQTLTLAGGVTPTVTLDLTNNGLVVNYPAGPEAEPFDTIRAQIISAYNGGGANAWTGPGITSSVANDTTHGVGYAESSAVFTSFPANFMGQSVDATAVLVRYTRYGDGNLDGTVSLADFNALAGNFGLVGGAVWTQGDFTYDGNVNLADFNKLAGNFGLSASSGSAPTPQDWSNLVSSVPEPGALAMLGAGALMTLGRRRRA